jgi:hypothetical protein
MSQRIKIRAGNVEVVAELNDGPTAKAVAAVLPIRAKGRCWGGEIYFAIPVKGGLEADSRDVVDVGELGYWPTGSAFCIFFGPTPASSADEPRAASAVNILGRIDGDVSGLWDVPNDAEVIIEAVE